MAFLRFTRDKRGYQHFYLVESVTNRRGKVRQRVLYWFRSPPDVKVGREPFDESVRRALEAQNPDVTFDWRAILDAPIPSADAEKWRERRRVERAAKQARAAALAEDENDSDEAEEETSTETRPAQSAEPAPATEIVSAGEIARKKRRRRRRRPVPAEGGAPGGSDESSADEIADAGAADDSNETQGD